MKEMIRGRRKKKKGGTMSVVTIPLDMTGPRR